MPIFLLTVKVGNIPVPWILRIGGRCSTKWTFFPILGGEKCQIVEESRVFLQAFPNSTQFFGGTHFGEEKPSQNLDLLVRWLEKIQNIPKMVVKNGDLSHGSIRKNITFQTNPDYDSGA